MRLLRFGFAVGGVNDVQVAVSTKFSQQRVWSGVAGVGERDLIVLQTDTDVGHIVGKEDAAELERTDSILLGADVDQSEVTPRSRVYAGGRRRMTAQA